MSFINKIPRGLRVLAVIVVLGILIWLFAADAGYFYYSIGGAVLVTFGVIVLVYKPFKISQSKKSPKQSKTQADDETKSPELAKDSSVSDTVEIESDYTDTPSIMRAKPSTSFRETDAKPAATDIARNSRPTTKLNPEEAQPVTKPISQAPKSDEEVPETDKATAETPENSNVAPSIPLVEDETTLTEEDKNQLVNAVWYRCENPYCKYTSFLGVHHIIDEKAGGTNRLDNLIVLCPYCHDLAHRNEIPEAEMREWISNRENRFKFKPDWKYF